MKQALFFLVALSLSFPAASAIAKQVANKYPCADRLSPFALPDALKPYKSSIKCSRFLMEKGLNQMEDWMGKDPAVKSAIGNVVTDAMSKKIAEKDLKQFGEDQGILIALKYLRSTIDYCLCLDSK